MSFSFNKLNFFFIRSTFCWFLFIFIYLLFIYYIYFNLLIHSNAYCHMDRQSVSVCVSGDGKSLRLKNASLSHDGRHTKRKLMTSHVCVRSVLDESKRAVKHVRARAHARFLRTMWHLPPLTASHTETLCPCDGTCSARAECCCSGRVFAHARWIRYQLSV